MIPMNLVTLRMNRLNKIKIRVKFRQEWKI